jgi:hypothetical protein
MILALFPVTRPAAVYAQSFAQLPAQPPAQPFDRLEIGAGLQWLPAVNFAAVNAVEQTPSGGTRVVFRSQSTLDAAVGGQARLGVVLTPVIVAEVGISRTGRNLVTTISGDVGNASGVPLERMQQYVFEVGVRYQIAPSSSMRWHPFVTAGVGYLRDLHEGSTLVDAGRLYYAGGGVRYVLRETPSASIKSLGIRGDVRVRSTSGGAVLDAATHSGPVMGLGIVATF